MSVWESIRIALRALRSNKMRTALTMLGIIIGVAAVIAMVALGQGAAKKIREQFESMGTNLLVVRAGSPMRRMGPSGGSSRNTLMPSDSEAIVRKFKGTIAMASQVCRGNGDVKLGNTTWTTSIVGATPEYETVAKMPVEEGRWLTDQEEKGRQRTVLVGRTVIEKLTGDRYASIVGRDVLILRTRFQVVGVLKERGAGGFGQDQDDLLIVPCNTAMRRLFNRTSLNEIDISCRTQGDTALATEQVVALLRDRHKLRPPFPDNDDFSVRSQAQMLEASAESSQTMTSLLGGIALV
ncbi:ABC transporter permease, partial [bacterium]|nr:ABC transporter permease [bacterium]